MAPPVFPNGMTLETIGFGALKYPAIPSPPVNVPFGNQIGALQHQPPNLQKHQATQIASQYLDALLEYQTSEEPMLHDKSSQQYYFSTVLCLLNYLSGINPDVCKKIAAHPKLINSVVEKMLDPEFEAGMKAVVQPQGAHFSSATFDADFGSLLQFVSTMLLYQAEMTVPLHPRISELIPKLQIWKRTYKNSPVRTIKVAAERLMEQIQGMEPGQILMVRTMQEQFLVCGMTSCHVSGGTGLTLCATCRVQRYCGRDHQRADWKYHKHICNKGFVEVAEG